jgi:CBS domain-containing protein
VEEAARTVAEAMLTAPVRHPPAATVGEIREFFRDEHVHAALIVGPSGRLQAVVERGDLAGGQPADTAAARLGRLAGRTLPPGASLAEAHRAMAATGQRRAAVTSAEGQLLGLLCLKASQAGFCSDQDVCARAQDRARPGAAADAGTD